MFLENCNYSKTQDKNKAIFEALLVDVWHLARIYIHHDPRFKHNGDGISCLVLPPFT